MEERFLEGQIAAVSIWTLSSQKLPGCRGTKRPGVFRVSRDAFRSVSSVFHAWAEMLKLLVGLCLWLLSPDTFICGWFLFFI